MSFDAAVQRAQEGRAGVDPAAVPGAGSDVTVIAGVCDLGDLPSPPWARIRSESLVIEDAVRESGRPVIDVGDDADVAQACLRVPGMGRGESGRIVTDGTWSPARGRASIEGQGRAVQEVER